MDDASNLRVTKDRLPLGISRLLLNGKCFCVELGTRKKGKADAKRSFMHMFPRGWAAKEACLW